MGGYPFQKRIIYRCLLFFHTNEKLHVVYDGESPDDYPGNPQNFSVAGWDYDRKEDE